MLIQVDSRRCAHARFEQWKSDYDCRASIRALALRANRTAVYLDEVSRNSESETQSTMLSSSRAISLSEAFKDVGQELLVDSLAGIRNTDFDRAASLRNLYANTPAAVRKLHRIRQQIPNDLLQPVCVAGNHRGRGVEMSFDPDPLRVSRGTHNVNRILDYRHDFQRVKIEIQITGDDARNVENVVDNLGLSLRIAPDSFNCLLSDGIIEVAAFE